jgi:hypothetical protein
MKGLLVLLMTVLTMFTVMWGKTVTAAPKPDFVVPDIVTQPDQFVHVILHNRSGVNCTIRPKLKEKIFLVLYINNVKRAEYKLKYLNPKLFKPNGKIRFRTNFRKQKGLKLRVVVNPLKIMQESNFSNNTKEKIITAPVP